MAVVCIYVLVHLLCFVVLFGGRFDLVASAVYFLFSSFLCLEVVAYFFAYFRIYFVLRPLFGVFLRDFGFLV